jgi:hypothetical protein
MSHTPGPWGLSSKQAPTSKRKYMEHGEKITLLSHSGITFGIAKITGPSNFDMQEEFRSNARLIAAAPDLLEACKELRKEVHEYRLLDIKKRFSLCTADAMAGTAIFKAEGQ